MTVNASPARRRTPATTTRTASTRSWALARFVDARPARSPTTTRGVTVNVGTFTRRHAKNTVPERAECQLDFRYVRAVDGAEAAGRALDAARRAALAARDRAPASRSRAASTACRSSAPTPRPRCSTRYAACARRRGPRRRRGRRSRRRLRRQHRQRRSACPPSTASARAARASTPTTSTSSCRRWPSAPAPWSGFSPPGWTARRSSRGSAATPARATPARGRSCGWGRDRRGPSSPPSRRRRTPR